MNTIKSETPLKDTYSARLKSVNADVKFTDLKQLAIGDYVMIKTKTSKYFGFVVSIGRVNVVITNPYGGWADSDYTEIMELKFKKEQISLFSKPKLNA